MGHYIKVILDEVFGKNKFVNEIVWHYSGAGTPKGCWAKRHDSIFLYSKGSKFVFNADEVRVEYSQATVERFKHKINNVRNGIDFGEQALNPLGKYPEDVLNISIEAPSSNNRTGYPTQKPEELLARIIKASTNEGDLIMDFFRRLRNKYGCSGGTWKALGNLRFREIILSDNAEKIAFD